MQNLLIIGLGDVALRCLPRLKGHYRILALLREHGQATSARLAGVTPILGDLDDRCSLQRLKSIADIVLHFAPPQKNGDKDRRTQNLLAALRKSPQPPRILYISTTGVYGNCGGSWVDETTTPAPSTARAKRRADAEQQLRRYGRATGALVSILRAPGIYARDRLPLERLRNATPLLRTEEDIYTNHIHAEDLATLAIQALRFGRANRCYNAVDDSDMKMGDFFDLLADSFNLPRAPRQSHAEVIAQLTPMQRSFINESRRISNARIKKELKIQLAFPSVREGIADAKNGDSAKALVTSKTERLRKK